MKPTQSMADFFNRDDVKAQQEIQRNSRPQSEEHKNAHKELIRLAKEIGAEKHFGEHICA